MGGRKAQVALFVLIGIVLVIGVALAIYIYGQKNAETATTTNEQIELQNNPELAAEKARMQDRMEGWLNGMLIETVDEFLASGVEVDTVAGAEAIIASEIGEKFPDAFFRFNTEDKLIIVDEDAPRVNCVSAAEKITCTVEYAVRGTYDGRTYILNGATVTVPSTFRRDIERVLAIRNALAGRVSGTGGSASFDAAAFIDENCNVDLYAFEDQGIYADLLTHVDGTMTAYFYDYANAKGEEVPRVQAELAACNPKNPAPELNIAPPLPDVPEVTCSQAVCAVAFDTKRLPEGFTIVSALDINPLTLSFNAAGYPAGDYHAFAQGTDDSGAAVTQQAIIHITEDITE